VAGGDKCPATRETWAGALRTQPWGGAGSREPRWHDQAASATYRSLRATGKVPKAAVRPSGQRGLLSSRWTGRRRGCGQCWSEGLGAPPALDPRRGAEAAPPWAPEPEPVSKIRGLGPGSSGSAPSSNPSSTETTCRPRVLILKWGGVGGRLSDSSAQGVTGPALGPIPSATQKINQWRQNGQVTTRRQHAACGVDFLGPCHRDVLNRGLHWEGTPDNGASARHQHAPHSAQGQ
jgi:hypothetical protein